MEKEVFKKKYEIIIGAVDYLLTELKDDVNRYVDKIVVLNSGMKWGEVEFFKKMYKANFPKGLAKEFDVHFLITNQYPYFGNYMQKIANFEFDGLIQKGCDLEIDTHFDDLMAKDMVSVSLVGETKYDYSFKQMVSLKVLLLALMFKFNLKVTNVYSLHYFDNKLNVPGFNIKKKVIDEIANLIKEFNDDMGIDKKDLYMDLEYKDLVIKKIKEQLK